MSDCLHQGVGGARLTVDANDECILTPEDIEFQQLLDSAIVDIYPVVLDRVRSAQFAGWQRRVGGEDDIAQQACAEFYAQCIRNQNFPTEDEKLLNYVVTIAKNIAGREYRDHINRQEFHVDPEDPKLGKLFAAEEEGTSPDFDNWLLQKGREEQLLNALSKLPPRQREAFELWIGNASLTYAELGGHMNISADGFRKNFDRACDALDTMLNSARANCPVVYT